MRKAALVLAVIVVLGAVDALAENDEHRGEAGIDNDLSRMRQRIEIVITDLRKEHSDFGGHKAKAERFLNEARDELIAAEATVSDDDDK